MWFDPRLAELVKFACLFRRQKFLQVNLVGVFDLAVEHGVSQGSVADGCVPMFNRKPAGSGGRTDAVAVVEPFTKVAPVRAVEYGVLPSCH